MVDTVAVRIGFASRYAASVLALSAMLLALGLAGIEDGFVLCFGGDGHVSIEAVGRDGCLEVAGGGPFSGSASRAAGSEIGASVSLSHCGPCVDVALAPASATKAPEAAKRAAGAAPALSTAPLQPPPPYHFVSIPPMHATRFLSERPYTVVIRC